MSIKKTLLLVSMALAAISASFAASAMAETPGTWADKGTALTGAASATVEGKAKFNTLGSGIECNIKGLITANEGGVISSTGNVDFSVPSATTNCVGFGSTFKKCKVKEIEFTTGGVLKFVYHLTKFKTGNPIIVVTNVSISSELENKGPGAEEKCPDGTVTIAFPTVNAIPDNSGSIGSVTFESEGTAVVDKGVAQPNLATTVEPLKVLEPNKGTYGII